MKDMIIFDGDDTLWRVERLYDDARERAAAIVSEEGIDPQRWINMQKEIDIASVSDLGLSPVRFPNSSILAYERSAIELGTTVKDATREKVRAVSSEVFEATAPLVAGAGQVVAELAVTHRLALLTQGDPLVQAKRISDSGLLPFFEIVHIVNRKDERCFSKLLAEAGVTPADAWSVGNSFPSDINPALRLGVRAIWIETHVWAYERREVEQAWGPLVLCDSLVQLPAVIAEHPVLVR
ncbi:hypothetical protein C5U48_05370 [Mycolicibacter virginiensis]|uniref:HAD family hydrolase n=1 Tax=Mycolicibacter virginiensis TaxID=1795032 RepID=A0A9X7NZT3_9MYCO|nr:HAD family hydrolase [Mycolicibacter virginiensis]PQM53306.1 hypothetical protein C5U48_05370 [Mycolicibacter virginiensis]